MKRKKLKPIDVETNPAACPESPDGTHSPDWESVALADDEFPQGGSRAIVDVACALCGRSGSTFIEAKDIDW